jgi:hypothetical protein
MIVMSSSGRSPFDRHSLEQEKGRAKMSNSDIAKRHRLSQTRIELDVSFLPDRLPQALWHPLDVPGRPDALIKIKQAEAYLSPASDQANRWQCSLTICPPGEGHFMKIDLSISEAKKLLEVLDHVINWEEDLKTRVRSTLKPSKRTVAKGSSVSKRDTKSAVAAKIKAKPSKPSDAKASGRATKKVKARKVPDSKAKSAGRL